MAAELVQDFGAVAVGHRFGDEIADAIGVQRVAPEHLSVRGLPDEVRLVVQNDGHQPARILERHEAAGPCRVAGKALHRIEERRVAAGDGEGFPERISGMELLNAAGLPNSGRRCGELLPQAPAAAVVLRQPRRRSKSSSRGCWRRSSSRSERRRGRPGRRRCPQSRPGARSVRRVARIFPSSSTSSMSAMRVPPTKFTPWRGEPSRQRPHDRIILIVDRTLDAGERFDAGEFAHEAMQVALELDRAVPGLKGEGRLPHVPEMRREERRRQPVGDAARRRGSLRRLR